MAIYTVKPNQNLFDVALHLYGSIEGLFDLLISNPSLNMTSDLVYGQELEYHEDFILNQSIVSEFNAQNIVPSSGARHVYFKRPEEDLLILVGVNAEMQFATFAASGEGEMIIDWGDNSDLEHITLTPSCRTVDHYFDSDVETRRIKIYGNNTTLKIIHLDTTGIGGSLMLCRPVAVDEYTCVGRGYPLTGLALLEGTYKVNLHNGVVADLTPIANMSLQELDLTDVYYMNDDVLDDYLVYIREHYDDRRPCTVHLTSEPTQRGYDAIDTILNEPEWNVSDTWKFYINGQLYTSANGTDTE